MPAYQITSIVEGVPVRGTAAGSGIRDLGKPIAGKTGTTNDEKDVWFIGFSPDLVVGIYVGYDKPRNLGRGASGGHTAAPVPNAFLNPPPPDNPPTPPNGPPPLHPIPPHPH